MEETPEPDFEPTVTGTIDKPIDLTAPPDAPPLERQNAEVAYQDRDDRKEPYGASKCASCPLAPPEAVVGLDVIPLVILSTAAAMILSATFVTLMRDE
ncbi:MAG TPA: hypothetical protein DEA69_02300 [Microbacterium sp.]|jgi:hypothetical protein|nr:hypothetical protein [Microbacterium sp.]